MGRGAGLSTASTSCRLWARTAACYPERVPLYCHTCAIGRQRIYRPPADPLATDYQLGKYLKHTVVDPTFAVQSIFNSTSTQAYERYLVNTVAAGAVEQDARGRWNLIVPAGREVGVRYEAGRPMASEDAIKAVLSSEDGRVHAFTIESGPFRGVPCVDCGRVAIA